MPKKLLRRFIPNREKLFENRFLKYAAPFLQHHNLWHINRRSIAGGVAAGVIGGMIPGPLQIITATLLAVIFRVNLPVAVFATFYTNPFTIGPLYWLAFKIGTWVSGGVAPPIMPLIPSLQALSFMEWTHAMYVWLLSLGTPLLIGLPILTAILAILGYFAVAIGWRIYIYILLTQRYRHAQTKQR